ncbi:hypothetical protein FACS1894187_09670 [Synergistales bacterium]|nr:hypothetical protein FACS1894187_09670 [Synergistales bacterium]
MLYAPTNLAVSGDISSEQIVAAPEIYYDKFHFMHIFADVVGLPLATYIRYRKLSLAGDEVWNKQRSILEIALDYLKYSGHGTYPSYEEMRRLNGSPKERLSDIISDFRDYAQARSEELRKLRLNFLPEELQKKEAVLFSKYGDYLDSLVCDYDYRDNDGSYW